MGVYFLEKSLSFQGPVLCVVFEILKLPQNFSPKLGYFQKNWRKYAKNEWKIQKSMKNNEQWTKNRKILHILEEILQKIALVKIRPKLMHCFHPPIQQIFKNIHPWCTLTSLLDWPWKRNPKLEGWGL